MADGGRYRRRRYAVLEAPPGNGPIRPLPLQPHFQSREYNPLNGGVARHFAPIEAAVLGGPAMSAAVRVTIDTFRLLRPAATARVQVHQFRIEAGPRVCGKPAPEGPHRDGVDAVLVMMVARRNIAGGASEIFDLDHRPLACHLLDAPRDTVIIDDRRVIHGVIPIHAIDPAHPAHRDVLVVTCHAAPDAERQALR